MEGLGYGRFPDADAFAVCSGPTAAADGPKSDLQPMAGSDDHEHLSKVVRAVQRSRRRRDTFFDADLFADPAWDMLLELYASHLEQVRISVSSLCIASHVPATTALRWIAKLEQDGLAVRKADPSDGRRTWIELTFEGARKMSGYFATRNTATFAI